MSFFFNYLFFPSSTNLIRSWTVSPKKTSKQASKKCPIKLRGMGEWSTWGNLNSIFVGEISNIVSANFPKNLCISLRRQLSLSESAVCLVLVSYSSSSFSSWPALNALHLFFSFLFPRRDGGAMIGLILPSGPVPHQSNLYKSSISCGFFKNFIYRLYHFVFFMQWMNGNFQTKLT